MQYFQHPKDVPLRQLKDEIHKFFNQINKVVIANVYGGEPLMYKQLSAVLEEIYIYKSKFKIFIINTNGTIVPSDELCRTLRKLNIRVYISDYGAHSKKIEEIRKKLNKYGVYHFTLDSENAWWDGCVPVMEGTIDPQSAFDNCRRKIFISHCVKDGMLNYCSFETYARTLGIIPDEAISSISVDSPVERIREYVTRTEPIPACAYCGGTWKSIPSGTEQASMPLPLRRQEE